MAEASQLPNSSPSVERHIIGPDYFGYYTRVLAEFLSREEDHFALLPQNSNFEGTDGLAKNDLILTKNPNITGSAPLFSDPIGGHLSDFRKEKLRSLVRQSLCTFTQEVNALLTPILQIYRVRSLLKESSESDHDHHPHKKQKINDDFMFLLDKDPTKLQEMTEEEAGELFSMIQHMEQKLEEFLDTVMSNCRPMTLAEKQQLRKLIGDLPQGNLDRLVEIVEHSKLVYRRTNDQIDIDLGKEDNVTLWRLYHYVVSVETARNLHGSTVRGDAIEESRSKPRF